MRQLKDLRRVLGLSLTEAFFELTQLRVLDVWQELARMGYGVSDYLDFTHKHWVVLPVALQIKYASEYQNWYAERLREGVERSFGGIVFRLIPPGKYKMGSPRSEKVISNQQKQKKIFIKYPFWCGKYVVTQKEWENVIRFNPSHFRGEDNPVETVSWFDCKDFCVGTKVDLLTEEQWEYACRAGTPTTYSFGEDRFILSNYAYYHSNSNNQTHPVGEKLPNSWGLYDVHGNVAEWCGTLDNDLLVGDGEVIRSGGWASLADGCRSSRRTFLLRRTTVEWLGFRVCKPVTV